MVFGLHSFLAGVGAWAAAGSAALIMDAVGGWTGFILTLPLAFLFWALLYAYVKIALWEMAGGNKRGVGDV